MVRRDFLRDFLWIHRRFPESHGKLDSPTGLSGWGWRDLDATSPWLNLHDGNFSVSNPLPLGEMEEHDVERAAWRC